MTRYVPIAVWLVCATIAAFAQTPSKPASGSATAPLVDEKRLVMQADQLALTGTVNVFGDPSKPGRYVQRVQLQPNTKTRPRYYDHDRWITVMKGTWWVGQGDVFRLDKLVPVREGGLMYQPASLKTYDMAGDAAVVLQVMGDGPVKSTHAEVDAKGMAVPIGGPYPEEAVAEGRGRGRGSRGQPPPTQQQQ